MFLEQTDPDTLMRYLGFISERHRVWERRSSGAPGPWSDDPVLQSRKFCNIFRVLDHGSQYVAEVLLAGESDPREVVFRAFLYRHTNRPDPFEFFELDQGRIPTTTDATTGRLDEVWAAFAGGGGKIFSTAYRVNASADSYHLPKYVWVLNSAREFLLPRIDRILAAETQAERAAILQEIPRVGPFMAMQILTDLGYSEAIGVDREDELALVGPGSERGIMHLTGGRSLGKSMEPWTRYMRELQTVVHRDAGQPLLPLPSGGARPLSLTDIQNSLCEFDKYERYLTQDLRARGYRPAHPGAHPAPYLPPHWN